MTKSQPSHSEADGTPFDPPEAIDEKGKDGDTRPQSGQAAERDIAKGGMGAQAAQLKVEEEKAPRHQRLAQQHKHGALLAHARGENVAEGGHGEHVVGPNVVRCRM